MSEKFIFLGKSHGKRQNLLDLIAAINLTLKRYLEHPRWQLG
jgi:hypothetical protein